MARLVIFKYLCITIAATASVLLASKAFALWSTQTHSDWSAIFNADPKFGYRDNTAPFVALTYPQKGALIKQTNAVVEVNFSESIDDSSVTPATFVVSDGSKTISGAIEHVDNTLRFYAETPFTGTQTYTVILSKDISDLSGNSLEAPYRWSFTIHSF